MPLSALETPYFKSDLDRFEQGDILRDITLIEWAEIKDDQLQIAERKLPYCVVLSQDCDLEHDYNNRSDALSVTKDKYLQSLLLCPAYPSESFRAGTHLSGFQMTMQKISSDPWGRIRQNSNPRYHYLQAVSGFQLPELVIDFKHYLTVPRDILYRDIFASNYMATVEIVYRDHLSGRFAHYLSRIGLPELSSP